MCFQLIDFKLAHRFMCHIPKGNKITAKGADELDFIVNCGCDNCMCSAYRVGAISPIS